MAKEKSGEKIYEQLKETVLEKKKDICIMLSELAKEHFAAHENAFSVSVMMTDDGELYSSGDGDCVAYARFSLADYSYPEIYIDDYEFEMFAQESDEYSEVKKCVEESGSSLISYVLKFQRDGDLYRIFKNLEYLKAGEKFLRSIWNNENNGIWDYLNRKRAQLGDK